MRILYVCLDRGIPVGGTKGASIHVAEMLRAFEAEGHEVAIAARAFAGSSPWPAFEVRVPDGFAWVPVRRYRLALRELRAGSALARRLGEVMASFQPDLVYERHSLFRTEAVGQAKRAGIRVALEVNAPLVWEERRFRGLGAARRAATLERRNWSGADLVVVPSEPMARRVRAATRREALVVPNAVDPSLFRPLQGAARREELELEDRFVVGFSGSLKAWHDLTTVVEGTARLAASARPALLFVGDGPDRAAVEERARRLEVETRFTGPVRHASVPEYLAATDVCVAPLPADPDLDYFSPLKALEYLACGRPTVVAAVGDLRRLAAAGVALAYRPGEPADLANRLRQLAVDPSLREALAARGLSYAKSRTWRAAARQVLQVATSASPAESSA